MENGSQGEQGLDRAARYIAESLGHVRGREEELRGQLQLVVEERKSLTTALRALNPEHPLVQQAAKAKRPGAGRQPTAAATRRVWEFLLAEDHADQPFSVPLLAQAIGAKTDDPIRRAVYALRDAEALRAVGKQKTSEHGQPSMMFRVMDREAGAAFVASLDG